MRDARSHPLPWLVLAALSVVTITVFPEKVPGNDHDFASMAMLTHWLVAGVAWGTDFIQNVGPLGFINSPRVYSGELAGWKFAANAGMAIALLYAVAVVGRLRPGMGAVAVALFSFFAYEGALGYMLLFALFAQPRAAPAPRGYRVVRVACFTVLSLAKTTFAMAILAFYAITAAVAFARRDPAAGRSVFEAAAYAILVLVLWVALGQDLAGLLAFARSSVAFTNGYTQTLVIYEPVAATAAGVAVVLLLAAQICARAYDGAGPSRHRVAWDAVPSVLARLALTFVVFKHAFVRADGGHLLFLAYYGVCASLIVALEGRAEGRSRRLAGTVLVVSIVSCVAMQSLTVSPWRHIEGRSSEIARNAAFVLSPRAHVASLDRELQESISRVRSPLVDSTLGGASFSYYGYKPAIALYSKGAFIPTYSTISFAGWNRYVAERDVEKVARLAPAYFIVDVDSIDYLYPPQNSPYLFRYILDNYRPVGLANDVFLYKRIANAAPAPKEPEFAWDARFDGAYTFNPKSEPEIVYIDLDAGIAERLLSFLYKPPLYMMELKFSDGTAKSYKVTRDHLRMGVSNSYVVRSNEELLGLNFGAKPASIVSLKITCGDRFGACPVAGRLEARRAQPPGYARNANADLARGIAVSLPVFNGVLHVESPFVPRAVGEVYLFHAPSRVEIPVPAGAKTLDLAYVMLETSYSHGGRSNGVDVAVSTLDAGEKKALLFQRKLDPLRSTEDRQPMQSHIDVPAGIRKVVLAVTAEVPGQDHFAIKSIGFH